MRSSTVCFLSVLIVAACGGPQAQVENPEPELGGESPDETRPPSAETTVAAQSDSTSQVESFAQADATAEAEPSKRPGNTVAETRTNQVIQGIVTQNRPAFRACFERELEDQPRLRGTLTVHFRIDPDGKVVEAKLNAERSTLAESRLVACATAEMLKIKFPPSSRRFEASVNYPFDFKP